MPHDHHDPFLPEKSEEGMKDRVTKSRVGRRHGAWRPKANARARPRRSPVLGTSLVVRGDAQRSVHTRVCYSFESDSTIDRSRRHTARSWCGHPHEYLPHRNHYLPWLPLIPHLPVANDTCVASPHVPPLLRKRRRWRSWWRTAAADMAKATCGGPGGDEKAFAVVVFWFLPFLPSPPWGVAASSW